MSWHCVLVFFSFYLVKCSFFLYFVLPYWWIKLCVYNILPDIMHNRQTQSAFSEQAPRPCYYCVLNVTFVLSSSVYVTRGWFLWFFSLLISIRYSHLSTSVFTARRVCIARTMLWQKVCLSVTRRYCVYINGYTYSHSYNGRPMNIFIHHK